MVHPLVKLIRNAVPVYPKPCVNISGGIDSTIILHHLSEKTDEQIYTYTVGFPSQETEFEPAEKVAQHYGTVHKGIQIERMLDVYSTILAEFDQPRFNLWPWWLARLARADRRRTCYIGEGGDEHFGGYWYKPKLPYMQYWTTFFTYVLPTYETVYRLHGVTLVVPFHPNNLSWRSTLPYWDEHQQKAKLRQAYRGILPNFVTVRQKHNGRFSYWVMWEQELQQYYPDAEPQTEDDIRSLLNEWVTKEWLRVRGESR